MVTGRPASGKSTLARILSREINYPLLSRDELKEGYIQTVGMQKDPSIALHVYETFFETIDFLVSREISLIAEAAFQDKLWKPKLSILLSKANIKIIICKINSDLAKRRFNERLMKDPSRDLFHSDSLVKEYGGLKTNMYNHVQMDIPTLEVDTTEGYIPSVEAIVTFIQKDHDL